MKIATTFCAFVGKGVEQSTRLHVKGYEWALEYKRKEREDATGDARPAKALWIEKMMRLYEDHYTNPTKINVFFGTWNVNDQIDPPIEDLTAWLSHTPAAAPMLYCIGYSFLFFFSFSFLFLFSSSFLLLNKNILSFPTHCLYPHTASKSSTSLPKHFCSGRPRARCCGWTISHRRWQRSDDIVSSRRDSSSAFCWSSSRMKVSSDTFQISQQESKRSALWEWWYLSLR